MTTTDISAQKHYESIKEVVLTDFLDVETETTFKADEIWKEKPAIVVVIRRPGCPFCREEARILNEHRDLIEKEMGFRMITVVHEKLGAATFKQDFWNGGETYWDGRKGFYKALGGGSLRWASIDQLLRPSLWFNALRNLRSGVRGNLLVGEGRIFGGLYIETVLGNMAPISKILEVCSEVSGASLKEAVLLKAKHQQEELEGKKAAAAALRTIESPEKLCTYYHEGLSRGIYLSCHENGDKGYCSKNYKELSKKCSEYLNLGPDSVSCNPSKRPSP
ncbi:hypothetical protein BG006_005830 [Podila minutissima]|uniref:Peroxiredoxin-like 2A n=1 Tax=Podila minutissima TaxID=64525 RepID=A0A9P5VM26_9FUNG|nr:hypothetical protein BG006_005830 [Podila minutissima]